MIDPAGIRFAAARLDARNCHGRIIGAGRGQTHIRCLRRTGTNFGTRRCRATSCSGVLLGRSQADLPRSGFFEDDHVAATARARPREVGEVAACVGEAVEGWPAPTTGARQLWTLSAAGAQRKPKVTDAHKAERQHVEQKPAQEFVGRHGHCAPLVDGLGSPSIGAKRNCCLADGAQPRLRQERRRGTPLQPRLNPLRPSQQGVAQASPAVFLCSFSSRRKGTRRQGKGSLPRCPHHLW